MRLKTSGLLAFVAILIVVAPVLAAAYSAPYTITETNSNAYTMLPVSVSVDNQWLADNGFMESDALDTRVETLGGLERPHMVVDDRTLTAVSVSADSQTNLYFTTGNSDLSAMDIITGYGGYLTVADAAALELGNDFEIEFEGYVGTTSGSEKYLVFKPSAFKTYVSATGEITSAIYGQTTTNLIPDGDGNYTAWVRNAGSNDWETVDDPVGAPDDDTTYLLGGTGAMRSSFTFGNLPAGVIDSDIVKLDLYVRIRDEPGGSTVQLKAFYRESSTDYDNTGVDPPDNYTDYSWEYTVNPATSSAWTVSELNGAEFGIYYSSSGTYKMRCTQVYAVVTYYAETTTVTATGVSSGEHKVKVTADTVDLKIYIDDIEEDSTALGGASVRDNGNDWIINQNNVLPYLSFYKHTVSSSLVTRYQPNAIIINTGEAGTADAGATTTLDDAILTQANDYWNGARLIIVTTTDSLAPEGETAVVTDFDAANDRLTFAALTAVVDAGDTYTVDFGTLPDREAASNDARITWGVNPDGVAVSLGGMVSEDQPVLGGIVEDETTDILPAVGVSDWFEEPDVSGVLLSNPLRPFVTLMSDTTNITELQAWRVLALAFILWVAVTAILLVRSHLLIAGIATGAAVGLAVAWTIFPMWALVFTMMAVVGGLVSERSPSL